LRAVAQRVSFASVSVEGEILQQIGGGLLILLAIGEEDQERDLEWMTDKILHLRCFEDTQGKMNLALPQVGGEILCISQFTLYGDCSRGNRPSFDRAAGAAKALAFYEKFIDRIREKDIIIKSGVFGSKMQVNLANEGPVTLILDSHS
jgi:D-tyrosyl-tRNA(Tyr) deacylase